MLSRKEEYGYLDKDNKTLIEGVVFNSLNDLEKIIIFIREFGYESEVLFNTKEVGFKNNADKNNGLSKPSDARIYLNIYKNNIEDAIEEGTNKKIMLTKGILLVFNYSTGDFSVQRKEDLDTKFYRL